MTPHFNGYAAILVRLERIPVEELKPVVVEAWLARAPRRLSTQYLGHRGPGGETGLSGLTAVTWRA
ncbi:MAG TPA: hypothetical protein VEH29_16730, partial [Acidimicrobiales bacterium]|nr:hypothetical protein [Acidimicrobiales bacterium]